MKIGKASNENINPPFIHVVGIKLNHNTIEIKADNAAQYMPKELEIISGIARAAANNANMISKERVSPLVLTLFFSISLSSLSDTLVTPNARHNRRKSAQRF